MKKQDQFSWLYLFTIRHALILKAGNNYFNARMTTWDFSFLAISFSPQLLPMHALIISSSYLYILLSISRRHRPSSPSPTFSKQNHMGVRVHCDFQSYIQWLQDRACAADKLETSPTAHSDVSQTAPLNPSETSVTTLSQMP